jgi:hypothetical protein
VFFSIFCSQISAIFRLSYAVFVIFLVTFKKNL